MDEIKSLAGPVAQRYFDKVEAERLAMQAKLDAEQAAKRAAEDEARRAAEGDKAQQPEVSAAKDDEMTDADAPKPEVEEAGDP